MQNVNLKIGTSVLVAAMVLVCSAPLRAQSDDAHKKVYKKVVD